MYSASCNSIVGPKILIKSVFFLVEMISCKPLMLKRCMSARAIIAV